MMYCTLVLYLFCGFGYVVCILTLVMLFLSFFHVACMATLTMQLVVWFCTLREDFGYTVLTLVHIFAVTF